MQERNGRTQIKSSTRPDFSLLLAKLEEHILRGEDPEACLKTLRREGIWKNVAPEAQMKWARLAQMAGDMDLALKIFNYINAKHPELSSAWIEHIELLAILGARKKAAQVYAASRGHLNNDQKASIMGMLRPTVALDQEDLEAPSTPFDALRKREQLIANFLDLFSGREDCFARQWVNKEEGTQGYVPVRRSLDAGDVEDHLSGNKTYGIYLMRSDSTVKTAVLDADLEIEVRKGKVTRQKLGLIRKEKTYMFSRVEELAGEAGLAPLVEFSGHKGYHFWFFFRASVPAHKVRSVLEGISRTLNKDLSCFKIEVFPKQDSLSGKGFGNLVKLPLGIHRLVGKRSYFIECPDRGVDAQVEFLMKARRSDPEGLKISASLQSTAKVFIHPRTKQWANKFSELARLEGLCPPLGQIIASCRNGMELSLKEEKVLFQTVGLLPRAKSLLHELLSAQPDYNPHLVDLRLSKVRGTPLGCKRIHSLLGFAGDICSFKVKAQYPHPLLHLEEWNEETVVRSEKIKDLASALENLKAAISQTEAFLK